MEQVTLDPQQMIVEDIKDTPYTIMQVNGEVWVMIGKGKCAEYPTREAALEAINEMCSNYPLLISTIIAISLQAAKSQEAFKNDI